MKADEKNSTTIVRINKAIQYIENNLASSLLLEGIAQEAHFSQFHFHRVFKAVVNETLHNYITRKRIERAAILLLHHPNKNITHIATLVGFTSISTFSRAFKKFYGLSATEFREKSPGKFSKICKTESKNGQVITELQQYICNIQNHLNFIRMKANSIAVKDLTELKVAYIPHIGPCEQIGIAFDKLLKWGYPKGLVNGQNKVITIYHDSPKITDPNKLRMSACISLPKENYPIDSSEINTRVIPAGKHVVAQFEITVDEFQKAWESVFAWVFEKGFKVRNSDPFEVYYNDLTQHPERKCTFDICIPVE